MQGRRALVTGGAKGIGRAVADRLPKRLYSRALLILVIPMVLLQCVIAYFFLERHWQYVTFRLSQALVQDVAALIDLYRSLPPGAVTLRIA